MSHKVLVVDDEPKLCDLLSSVLSQNAIEVFTAGNGLQALTLLEQESIDLVISDWRMPGMDGPQLLAEIKLRYPHIPVIVMTAYSTVKNAVQSMRNGAYDYIAKPFDIDELDITVSKALQFRDILRDNARLRAELDEHQHIDSLIGDSPSFRRVLQAIDSVRDSNATILLTGESGTGKEMVARAIHKHGSRADQPFVAVNCAAIPEGLLESEMFGHRKGAFTGAVADRIGRFLQADKGTLFLDEIGDMPLTLQAKILRALQERVIEPVGETRERKVDVRVIAATHKNLLEAVAKKEFREDLYYRLNVFPIPLPALRERVEDITPLARHFAHSLGATAGKRITDFSPTALQAMMHYHWPGNIRELQNCVERATIVATSSTIEDSDLPPYLFSGQMDQADKPFTRLGDVPPDLEAALAEVERAYILAALQQTQGVQAAAAQLIGISERSLWYRLKKLDIHVDKIARMGPNNIPSYE
ncbi:sigma-54-dependent Fis family transcriptional regulator [Pseudomonas saxonica]|uniref:Sigma-54-dependent Fis family transcriptional regulator n=1 Tax=Pseudomonas saxonica TaxID=2600598 RepID=A0ABY3GP87_9PSED|nr:sigma-54 dependent transcriptional regulator [Pseudomonas saxonica]TWR92916.1 sigma-54-dependent Fis family transcriptional regulator [Pseudomonas saxonica]